jgi:hypothetical protein
MAFGPILYLKTKKKEYGCFIRHLKSLIIFYGITSVVKKSFSSGCLFFIGRCFFKSLLKQLCVDVID